MDSNKSVTASFTAVVVTAHHFHLKIGVTGAGTVTTTGLNCPSQCEHDYAPGTSLTLTAAGASDYNFLAWGGDCAQFGAESTCSLQMNSAKDVTAVFSTNPAIGDLGPPGSDQLPPTTQSLQVNVAGADGGIVAGRAFAASSLRDGAPPIDCGGNSYGCYGDYTPGTSVTLTAKPLKGFKFKGWQGACATAAKKRTCSVKVDQLRNVTATFAPRGKRVTNLSMARPSFQVRWSESSGKGKLIVKGSVAKRARLTLELRRRRDYGALLHVPLVRRAGTFTIAPRVRPTLARGARLLPGNFVVSLRGNARGFYLPTQLQTVDLPGPPEGVVRISFASTSRAGRTVKQFPASARIAWANFRLAQQPKASFQLWVYWLWPDGVHILGAVQKPNRPIVSSYLRDVRPLPHGCWRADLYVGPKGGDPKKFKRIKRQLIKIGTSRC
jgi:hypothetical protein